MTMYICTCVNLKVDYKLTNAARAGFLLLIACLAMSANDTEQEERCNFSTITFANNSPSLLASFTLRVQSIDYYLPS